eukprot:Seg1076.5 transcript_id=Seg1076.5/GoldUCD/mRNA.D3Y31 product="Kappa-type opioid receptor" protein_id=Seg1076.5/GoldUCD/D3Y31
MKPFYLFLVITYITNFAIGFMGNILVLVYLYDSLKTSEHLNKSLAWILINLAIADILTEIFGTVGVILEFDLVTHPTGVYGDVLCKIITSHTLTWSFTNVSVLTVVLLTWERYRAVTQFKSKAASDLGQPKYIKYLIGSFWILGPAMYSPYIAFQVLDPTEGCKESFPNNATKYAIILGDIIPFYVCPIIFFIFAYTKIVLALKKPPKEMSERRKRQFSYNKVRRKLTLTAMIIVCGYFICWSGAYIIYTVQSLANLEGVAIDTAWEISLILAYFASTSHPIIYSFQSRHFRKKTKTLFEGVNCEKFTLKITHCCQESKVEPDAASPYVMGTTEDATKEDEEVIGHENQVFDKSSEHSSSL